VLRLENLGCALGGGRVAALRGIDLTVEAGEFVFIAGRSGSGKSTLARCLCGLTGRIFPGRVSGRIELAGTTLDDLEPWEVVQRVGFVFQDPSTQLFAETVEEEVACGPENLGLPPSEIGTRLQWALEATGITDLRHRRTDALSLGERQKVALASVLSLRPSVLVLDEPTSMLDERSALAILERLSRLAADEGVAVIVLEHRTRYIAPYATRLVILREGAIAYDGPVEPIRDEGFCRQFDLRHGAVPAPGRAPADTPSSQTERVASAEGLSFAYRRGAPVFSDIALDVCSGAATVVSGPNGSGKTTLLKLFAGLLRPTGGRVCFSNHGPSASRAGPAAGIAFVGQEPAYLFRHRDVQSEYASWQDAGNDGAVPHGLLASLGLWDLRSRHPLSLSEGEKRRLSVAAALAAGPRLLLLDEPSVGFDGYHLDRLLQMLDDYTAKGGALLVASNDPDVLQQRWPRRYDLTGLE